MLVIARFILDEEYCNALKTRFILTAADLADSIWDDAPHVFYENNKISGIISSKYNL